MKLDLHKNLSASITLDKSTMMSHDNTMVYGKAEGDDIYLFVKDPRNGRTMKIHIRKYAEEVRDEMDI